jgi:hypothetical protein
MVKTFNVKLESGEEFAAQASYDVTFEDGQFGCWIELMRVVPLEGEVALSEQKLDEIESVVAYMILDNHETLKAYDEKDHYPC